jgi:hypothetical protein
MSIFKRHPKIKCNTCGLQGSHDHGLHKMHAKQLARGIKRGQAAYGRLEVFFCEVPAAETLFLEYLARQKSSLDIEAGILRLKPDEVKIMIESS